MVPLLHGLVLPGMNSLAEQLAVQNCCTAAQPLHPEMGQQANHHMVAYHDAVGGLIQIETGPSRHQVNFRSMGQRAPAHRLSTRTHLMAGQATAAELLQHKMDLDWQQQGRAHCQTWAQILYRQLDGARDPKDCWLGGVGAARDV